MTDAPNQITASGQGWQSEYVRLDIHEKTVAELTGDLAITKRQLAERDKDTEFGERRLFEMSKRIAEYEEREGACCPEDVGFDEYIKSLERRIAELKTMLAALPNCKCDLAPDEQCELYRRIAELEAAVTERDEHVGELLIRIADLESSQP